MKILELKHQLEISKNFKGKIFKTEDIRELIKFFNTSFNETADHKELSLNIVYQDGTSVEGFDESILMNTKIIDSLDFSFKNYSEDKKIHVRLTKYNGSYKIKSSNQDWVRAKISFFEEYLEGVANQNVFFSSMKYQVFFMVVLSLILGGFLEYLFADKLLNENIREYRFGVSSIFNLVSYILICVVSNKFFSLYPDIEFDTTKDHINRKKKIKVLIINFIILVIIPLLVNYIYDIISK